MSLQTWSGRFAWWSMLLGYLLSIKMLWVSEISFIVERASPRKRKEMFWKHNRIAGNYIPLLLVEYSWL
jgi:hypothetical protein